MMKYIRFCIKAIPVLTIVGGFISGGGRLGPFLDTAKVAVTQYEVVQITKLVYEDISDNKGKIVKPAKFSSFVQEHYHSQYSILAREVVGNKSDDMSQDLWNKSFQIVLLEDFDQVKIASCGPDGKIGTKDDIAAEFPYQFNRAPKAVVKKRPTVVVVEEMPAEATETPALDQDSAVSDTDLDPRDVAEAELNSETDENLDQAATAEAPVLAKAEDPKSKEGDERKPASKEPEASYDDDGFDRDGYDRDGYDINGIHRSEKTASIQE